MNADLNNLSISELKKIKKDNQQKLKNEYIKLKKKQKLIEDIKKYKKQEKKLTITKPKLNPSPNPRHLRITFRSVLKIRKFHLILQLIFVKHLKEQLGSIIKE